jgi:hypothetical protein
MARSAGDEGGAGDVDGQPVGADGFAEGAGERGEDVPDRLLAASGGELGLGEAQQVFVQRTSGMGKTTHARDDRVEGGLGGVEQ